MTGAAAGGMLEEQQVRAMFDRIAGVYDRMNRVMTAGLDARWRSRAADLAALGEGGRALDVACGTGDLTLELAARVGERGEVVGCDFSASMLELARRKAPGIQFDQANALHLPYPDDAFDAATVGFGARNFSDLRQGLAEMARVVRPGGRVVVLEITNPQRPPLSWFSPGVVRPPGAHARARHRAGRRLQLPAQLGAPLPRARGACGYARIRGPREDSLGVDRGRNHRHPRRGAPVVATAPTVDAVVRAAGPHVGALMGRIEERLAAVIAGHGELLAAHAGSTIAAGASACGRCSCWWPPGPDATGDGVVRAAVAVELVHSATLVHDDVLDAADLRRGRPTVVAPAGRDIATATGDLLFSRAFAELADNGRGDEVRVLSDARLGAGRAASCCSAPTPGTPASVERYLRALRAEDRAAVRGRVPARRARGASDGRVEALGAFGRRVGLAFQLLDDVLDVSGPAERTGKHRGADLLDGTVTLPLILARERDPELAALDPRSVRTPAEAEAVCDADRGDRRARGGQAPGAGHRGRGQGGAARAAGPPARGAGARRRRRRRTVFASGPRSRTGRSGRPAARG